MTHHDIPGDLFEQYASAVLQKDAEALLSLYDDDVRVFDLWSEWSYEGKAAWRVAIGQWFGSIGEENVGFLPFPDVEGGEGDRSQWPANAGAATAMSAKSARRSTGFARPTSRCSPGRWATPTTR